MGSGLPASLRGGLMAVAGGPVSVGRPQNFCREILLECERRGFQGVLCDWEEPPTAFLKELLGELERQLADRGLQLYVPEEYAFCTRKAGLLVSSALCGGSLELRLKEGLERFGPDRLVLALQRSAEDFQLPAPEGRGRILKAEELKQMLRACFSRGNCVPGILLMWIGGDSPTLSCLTTEIRWPANWKWGGERECAVLRQCGRRSVTPPTGWACKQSAPDREEDRDRGKNTN